MSALAVASTGRVDGGPRASTTSRRRAVYVVSQLPDGKSKVTLRRRRQRRPPADRERNVVATYRYGAGAASPPAGRLTTILKPQPNLASVHNPVAVWGGADPQQPDDVRANAPASVLTFGRAISADDYETIAALAPGVSPGARVLDLGRRRSSGRSSRCTSATTPAAAASAERRARRRGGSEPARRWCSPATPDRPRGRLHARGRRPTGRARRGAAATAALGRAARAACFSRPSMGIGRPLYRARSRRRCSVAGVEAVRGLSVTGAEPRSSRASRSAGPTRARARSLSSRSSKVTTGGDADG